MPPRKYKLAKYWVFRKQKIFLLDTGLDIGYRVDVR